MIGSQAQQVIIESSIMFFSTTLYFGFSEWCFKNNRSNAYWVIYAFIISIIIIFRAYASEDLENYVRLSEATIIMSAFLHMPTLTYKSIKNSFARGEDLNGWREILLSGCILGCLVSLFFLFLYTNTTGLIVAIVFLLSSFILFILWYFLSKNFF